MRNCEEGPKISHYGIYIYAIRIERVNQISGQNFIGLKYVSDDIKNVEKIFEKNFFGVGVG